MTFAQFLLKIILTNFLSRLIALLELHLRLLGSGRESSVVLTKQMYWRYLFFTGRIVSLFATRYLNLRYMGNLSGLCFICFSKPKLQMSSCVSNAI